jgi:uncharacterized membrane protein YagU involved in acid resistance
VAIISGLVYGLLVMLVMIFIVVPIVGAPDLPRLFELTALSSLVV